MSSVLESRPDNTVHVLLRASGGLPKARFFGAVDLRTVLSLMRSACGNQTVNERDNAMRQENLGTMDLQKARALLEEGNFTCVLKHGETILTSMRRGVAPLLAWLDDGIDTAGFAAADRVVGNGAAFLYVLLGVSEVYGAVMSDAALQTLSRFGIVASYGQLVDHIVNRTNTGCCPMEEAVSGIEDPKRAHEAIVARLADMAAADAR